MFKMAVSEEDSTFPTEFERTPLHALNVTTRRLVGYFLNLESGMVTVKDDNEEYDIVLSNNMEGLAELAGFSYQQIMNMALQSDPTTDLIQQWAARQATVGDMWIYLTKLGRLDVLTSCRRNILKDCREHIAKQPNYNKCQIIYSREIQNDEKASNDTQQKHFNDKTDENDNQKAEEKPGENRLHERNTDRSDKDNHNNFFSDKNQCTCNSYGVHSNHCEARSFQNQPRNDCNRHQGSRYRCCDSRRSEGHTQENQNPDESPCERNGGELSVKETRPKRRNVDQNENLHDSVSRTENDEDEFEMVTYDDIITGHNRTNYHAFISYSDESEDDRAFVRQIIQVLELEHGLKLFIPGRDDIPGSAQNAVTAYIIEKRCGPCVVILSNDFLKSPVCNFHLRFTQALSPAAQHRRIIPVIRHKNIQIPRFLNFVTSCDFTKSDMPSWVWTRLFRAIDTKSDQMSFCGSRSLEDSLKDIPFPIQRRLEE